MYAAIDLGSNSFHLLIASHKKGQLTIVERYSETVQLGQDLAATGHICDDALARGLACLADFKASLARHPVSDQRCFGTNALRVAANREDFIARAAELGFNVEVISGEREAELIYRGVTSRLQDVAEHCLVFDIGGGSTEFAVGTGQRPEQVFSIDLGCVSWRDRFFSEGQAKKKLIDTAAEFAKERLQSLQQTLSGRSFPRVYASSGTAKMLCSIAKELGQPPGMLSQKGLKKIRKQASKFDSVSQIVLPGLKPHRQDLLLPGIAIMKAIMETLELDEVHFSPTAMREGMLQEMATLDAGR